MGTKIEWTGETWNPVTGCTKVSEGCRNCYAEAFSLRLQAMGNSKYAKGFDVAVHYDTLDLPEKWKRPRTVFVNSMSDLFHDDVPTLFIVEVMKRMWKYDRHTYQVLTKRSRRLLDWSDAVWWKPNIYLGVSVESMDVAARVDDLRKIPAAIRFISCEPLLGSLRDLDLSGMDWVILGGESGRGARRMKSEWVIEMRDKCEEAGIPFFFKQWGGSGGKSGCAIAGVEYKQFPKKKGLV